MNKKISLIGTIVVSAFLCGMATSASADVADGAKLYERNCQGCHGADLKGSPAYPNLLASAKTATKEDFIKAVITEGKSQMAQFKGNEKVKAGIDNLYEFISSKKK